MPSYKKPAKAEDDSRRATDGDSGAADVPTGPDWSLGQVPAEDAVLSGVFALRPARIPDDVYAFALSLNADGSERAQMETDEVDDLSDISEGPPPPPPDSDVDGPAPTFEVEAAAQIGRAITELSRLREDLLLDAETQLIELAGVIARRVVARELRTDSSFLRSLVKEGLAALAEADQVVVRLGSAFAPHSEPLLQQLAGGSMRAEVLIDEDLAPSGCVIETTFGRVDESLETRFDVLMGSLRPELDCD